MTYKRFRQITAAALAALMTAALFGCGGGSEEKENKKDNEATETVEKTTLLTNVFESSSVGLPEDFRLSNSVTPYFDRESGDIYVLATHSYESEEVDPTFGYKLWVTDIYMVTIRDGAAVEQRKLDMEGVDYVNDGVLTADSLYFVTSEYSDSGSSVYVNRFDINEGVLNKSERLNDVFQSADQQYLYIDRIAVDSEGMIYMSSDSEIAVLNKSFEPQFSIPLQSWVSSMPTSYDGSRVYVLSYDYSGESVGLVFKPIDKAGKCLGEPLALDGIEGDISDCYFGPGYDIYFTRNDSLWGYNFPGDDSAAADSTNADGADSGDGSVKILDFQNSDLIMDNITIAAILSDDSIMAYEMDAETYGRSIKMLNRAADIDLSQVSVIELAHTGANWELNNEVINFNKANRGKTRIVLRDYSVYNTDTNYNAGAEKLIQDMVTGIYKPDMVTGYSSKQDVISQVYRNNLYTDLYPYIDKSGNISRDDIFGCVKRTFEDENGALWAIGTEIQVSTLLVKNSDLERSGLNLGGTGWTLSDMLAFEKSLPDGESLFEEAVTKDRGNACLLGDYGFGVFVDLKNGTCSFDSPEFMSYLELLSTLPDNFEYAEDHDWDTEYIPFHEGKIALEVEYYYGLTDYLRDETVFNTRDFTRIGFPTSDGQNGSEINIVPYIITKYCEYPEEAWSFIEQLMNVGGDNDELKSSGRYRDTNYVPVLKSQFYKACEIAKQSRYEIYFDGSMSWGSVPTESTAAGDLAAGGFDTRTDEELEEEIRGTGIVRRFTDENRADIEEWLDNVVGRPIAGQIDQSLSNIVTEEISAYLNGAKTAEDCARIIQSRVTIWISEHS